MALTKNQARQQILDIRAERDALTAKIDPIKTQIAQLKEQLRQLDRAREPLQDQIDVLVERFKRLYNEDA